MEKKTLTALAMAAAFIGCTTDSVTDKLPVPSQSEIDDAKARVGYSSDAAGMVYNALKLLGVIPVYTCGEPRSSFSGKLPANLSTGYAGAAVTLNASDPAEDKITVAFPAAGTTVHKQKVTGSLLITTAGGEDRFTLEVDARNALVNGKPVQALAGYGTCGDSTTYWTEAEGTLPGTTSAYALETHVGKKAGLPLIGSTTLLINAAGTLGPTASRDQVTLKNVDYKLGDILPQSGTIIIVTASGRRISASFNDDTPMVGLVTVRIDSKAPVTIPLPGF